jgi:hypothetical protein
MGSKELKIYRAIQCITQIDVCTNACIPMPLLTFSKFKKKEEENHSRHFINVVTQKRVEERYIWNSVSGFFLDPEAGETCAEFRYEETALDTHRHTSTHFSF